MKINLFYTIKYLLLAIPFLLVGMGCSDSILEISPQSTQTHIEQTVKGITFKFCLYNEQGQEATVFKEGEDFTFYFLIHNGTGTDIVVANFLNDDIFRVTKLNPSVDMGKPWTSSWCLYSLTPHDFPIPSGEKQVLSCDWTFTTQPTYPICGILEPKSPLPKGDYLTVIKRDFHYIKNGKNNTISNGAFIINFKVQ